MKRPPTPERLERIRARLEARRAARGMAAEPCCVIVPFDSPMLPDEYGAMLREQGRKSPALVLPETPSTPEQIARWADSCRRYHEWLLSRVPVDGLTTDVHGDLIRRAHRAAWAGDPMPDE